MLQRLKISRKLAILVGIPLLSLVLLGLIAAQTLQQVRIGGEAYGRIVDRKDLIADVVPPPLYLVDANLAAHRLLASMGVGGTLPATDSSATIDELAALERTYDDRLAAWQARLDPDDPITKQLVDQVNVAGADFWRIYHDDYLPAVRNASTTMAAMGATATSEQANDVISPVVASLDDLNTAFDAHKERVETLVAMAQADLELQEQAADDLTRQQMLLLAGAALAIVVIVAAAGSLMARSIAGPIRALTNAANDAATAELPELVQTVRDLPAGAELPVLTPLRVDGSEEITQLSASFESLRNTAVQLAAGESQLRQNVSSMFVNLGRRNQNLLNRTLNFITSLESNERNPETLDNLFRLDHLVTRMRRNAESLLVLAGTESSRTWSEPVEIGDIVRGALSEIEAYDRVDISALEPVDVRGNAAADVSHMLAELLENATTFSPPSAPVSVVGTYTFDGYVLSITDNGIGMTQRELTDANERLSQASKFDTSPLMVLGLFVVSRLGLRHGIQVRLAQSDADGVTAKVKLPLELLEGSDPQSHVGGHDTDFAGSEAFDGPAAAAAPAALLELGASLELGPSLGAAAGAAPTAAVAPGPAVPSGPAVPPGPADPAVAIPPATDGPGQPKGLVRRRRGAQMPDTGPEAVEPAAPEERSPAEVRSALAAFQGGVEYGRSEQDELGAPEATPAADAPLDGTPAASGVPAPQPAAPSDAPPAGAPAAAKTGLSRRIRGANMFDTGPAAEDNAAAPARSADDVRSALSSFQLGQNQAAKETAYPDNGNQ